MKKCVIHNLEIEYVNKEENSEYCDSCLDNIANQFYSMALTSDNLEEIKEEMINEMGLEHVTEL